MNLQIQRTATPAISLILYCGVSETFNFFSASSTSLPTPVTGKSPALPFAMTSRASAATSATCRAFLAPPGPFAAPGYFDPLSFTFFVFFPGLGYASSKASWNFGFAANSCRMGSRSAFNASATPSLRSCGVNYTDVSITEREVWGGYNIISEIPFHVGVGGVIKGSTPFFITIDEEFGMPTALQF